MSDTWHVHEQLEERDRNKLVDQLRRGQGLPGSGGGGEPPPAINIEALVNARVEQAIQRAFQRLVIHNGNGIRTSGSGFNITVAADAEAIRAAAPQNKGDQGEPGEQGETGPAGMDGAGATDCDSTVLASVLNVSEISMDCTGSGPGYCNIAPDSFEFTRDFAVDTAKLLISSGESSLLGISGDGAMNHLLKSTPTEAALDLYNEDAVNFASLNVTDDASSLNGYADNESWKYQIEALDDQVQIKLQDDTDTRSIKMLLDASDAAVTLRSDSADRAELSVADIEAITGLLSANLIKFREMEVCGGQKIVVLCSEPY